MSRFLFAGLALLLAAPLAHAQAAAATRYWIVVGTEGGAEAPATPRAVARRALRASEHALTHPDRGVNPNALAHLRALGVEPLHESRWLGAVSAELTPEQAAAVAAMPEVRSMRRTARLVEQGARSFAPYAVSAPSDVFVSYGPSAAQLRVVRADAAIEAGRRGQGVLFGILDTLFDFNHPALAHIGAAGRLRGYQNFVGGSQSNYHGLACSSIALGLHDGQLVGPAYSASLLAGTTEFAPTETHAEEDAYVAGLEWMEAQGADVVSVSLGYTTFDDGGDFTYADMDGNTTAVTRASDVAVSLGLAVVVAAGNEGNTPWHFITAPADADSVITVGAANPDGTRVGFSSVGPTADGRMKPDVAALGTGVYVAEPGGGEGFGGGTSYATPMVAGVVAQLLGARPSLTPIQIRTALRSTASRAANPSNDLGWGVVDAVAAYAAASTAAEPSPAGAAAWSLRPNVARAGTTLTLLSGADAALDLQLVDVLGRRVGTWRAEAGRSAVEVPRLPPGAYFAVVPGGPALRLVVTR